MKTENVLRFRPRVCSLSKAITEVLRSTPVLAVSGGAILGAAFALAPAHRVAAQQPQQQQALEEITVTGSRIQRESGFTTPVPLTAVTTEDLAGFKPGATLADQLDQLPQFFQTQSAQRGGGALFGGAGRSVVDLRAMGPQRDRKSVV